MGKRYCSSEKTRRCIKGRVEQSKAVVGRNDDLQHLVQSKSNQVENGKEFRLKGSEAVQAAAIPATGFDEGKLVKTLKQTPGRHLQALLLDLTLE